MEYVYLSHLCRCYIMNGRPWESWNLYLSCTSDGGLGGGAGSSGEGGAVNNSSWNLLYLMAHDCYKVGHFYYAAKAFDALESLEPTTEYWNGKRGACCGVFQQVIAGKDMKEHLLDIMQMLTNDPNPQANFILRVMRQWCHENGVQDYWSTSVSAYCFDFHLKKTLQTPVFVQDPHSIILLLRKSANMNVSQIC